MDIKVIKAILTLIIFVNLPSIQILGFVHNCAIYMLQKRQIDCSTGSKHAFALFSQTNLSSYKIRKKIFF